MDMVLRRFAKAIRSQDWFTVFVELVVLIVGVFLGLQVDDWNQRRLDRIEEQYYLDRLGRDLKHSLIEQEEQLEAAKMKFDDTLAIQNVLETGDLGSMTVDEFEHRIGMVRGFASSTLVTATMQELIAGGKASLLQSDELREELADFNEWYARHKQSYEYVSGSIMDAYRRFFGFLRPDWPDLDAPPAWSADVENLMNDPDAKPTMRQLTNAYWIRWRDLRRLNRETRELYELLCEVTAAPRRMRVEGCDNSTVKQ
jgi:hypothetical protein